MPPIAPQTTSSTTTADEDYDFRKIPIALLIPTPLNPRKTINEKKQAELVASIREKGVRVPLLVRERTGIYMGNEQFEIVAGERRYLGAKEAKKPILPCVVCVLTDAEVVELALIENHQRADVHPLEEAAAIQQLLDLDRAYTVAGVAAKLGVSKSWVYGRLKLLRMVPAAQAAYLADALTAEHADLLAPVPTHQQDKALAACFIDGLFDGSAAGLASVPEAIAANRWDLLAECLDSTSRLKRWIASHTTADIQDEAVQEQIADLDLVIADAAEEGKKAVLVSLDEFLTESAARELGVIRLQRWIEIIDGKAPRSGRGDDGAFVSGKRCEAQQSAAIAHPADKRLWRTLQVCTKRSCPVHRPPAEAPAAKAGKSDQQIEQERLAEEQQQREDAARIERTRVWREEQLPFYLAEVRVRAQKVKSPTQQLVMAVLGKSTVQQVSGDFGIPLNNNTALAVLLLALAPPWMHRDSQQLSQFGAAFGITPDQWVREQKAAGKAAKNTKKPAAAKSAKAKKKGGR